jgi:short-subunit dehydrogenase
MRPLKSIVLTGATSGIGRHTALHLARRGHFVFACGRREDRLEALVKETVGFDLRAVPMDVDDPDSVDRAHRQVERLTGHHGIQVVINNAGFGQPGPMEMVTDQELHAQFETNVVGLMRVTRKFLPRMRDRHEGRIINVSSVLGHFALPYLGAYCASKHAVNAVSDALRLELRPHGVKVIIIEPGAIRTEFTDRTEERAQAHLADDSPYTPSMRHFREKNTKHAANAPDPTCIAKAITHAVESRHPRRRYRTPMRERLITRVVQMTPTWLTDRAIASMTGLSRK